MIVKIVDHDDDGKFVEYNVFDLSQSQMNFLNDALEEETSINGDIFKIKMYFDDALYPFQSEIAKIRIEDFIAREEIEMNIFLSSFLEDM